MRGGLSLRNHLVLKRPVWATAMVAALAPAWGTVASGALPPVPESILENALYVATNKEGGINKTISQCGDEHCVVVIPEGDYELSSTLNLRSNLTLINHGRLFASESANFMSSKDKQGKGYAYMIYGDGLDNVRIHNHGLLSLAHMHDPEPMIIIFIDNSKDVVIHGGRLTAGTGNNGHGLLIANSSKVEVSHTHSTRLNAAVWQECTSDAVITDISCVVGGHEGECIDMNGYSQNVSISDISVHGGNFSDDQAIDLNANRNVTLKNIHVRDAFSALKVTGWEPGIRYGTCGQIISGGIRGENVRCENCASLPIVRDVHTLFGDSLFGDNAAVTRYPNGLQEITDFIITRDRVAGPHLLTPDNRRIFLYDMASYEGIYSGLTNPIIESDYNVYLQDGYLIYTRDVCSFAAGQKFFLHLYPADLNDLPKQRRDHGFDKLDFDSADPHPHAQVTQLPHLCVAKRLLPDYEFARIRTGEYAKEGKLWEGSFSPTR